MRALKITADRMAEVAECRFITSIAFSQGSWPRTMPGRWQNTWPGRWRSKSRQSAGHQQLLADLDNLDQLGRIAVEVDHVAGFFGCLRARVHGDADVGLGEGRGVVVPSPIMATSFPPACSLRM